MVRLSKKDQRRQDTRQHLIDVAQELFARIGITAVSLRQIGIEAGSLNTNVIGYYFGAKEALIEAIFRSRLPSLDRRRAAILHELDEAGRGEDVSALIEACWSPLFDERDDRGFHSFAIFVLNCDREGYRDVRQGINQIYPASAEILRRLQLYYENIGIGDTYFAFRLQLLLISGALEYGDRKHADSWSVQKKLFDEALKLACLASRVPQSDVAQTSRLPRRGQQIDTRPIVEELRPRQDPLM